MNRVLQTLGSRAKRGPAGDGQIWPGLKGADSLRPRVEPDFRFVHPGDEKPGIITFGVAKRPAVLGEGQHLEHLYNTAPDHDARKVIQQATEYAVRYAVRYFFITSGDWTTFAKVEKGPEGQINIAFSHPLEYTAVDPSVMLGLLFIAAGTEMEQLDSGLWPWDGIRLEGPYEGVFANPTGPQRPRRSPRLQEAQQQEPQQQQQQRQHGAFGKGISVNAKDLLLGADLSPSRGNATVMEASWQGAPAAMKIVKEDAADPQRLNAELAAELTMFLSKLKPLQGLYVPQLLAYGCAHDNYGPPVPFLLLQRLGAALSSENVTEEAAQAALRALRTVHLCGVAHRDISLSNFVHAPNNEQKVFVVDFGLAAADADVDELEQEEAELTGLLQQQCGVALPPLTPELRHALRQQLEPT